MVEKEQPLPQSLFGIIASFGVGGVIRALIYTLGGGVLFGILGYIAFLNGPGSTQSELGTFWRVVVATLMIPTYAILGGGGGLVLAIARTILNHTENVEILLNRFVNPLMALLVEKLSPDKGVPVDEYMGQLDEKIERLQYEKVSAFAGPTRWLYRVILRVFRRFAAKNLLSSIQSRGESLVTRIALERFIREGLVSFLREEFEDQIDLIRYGVYAILGVLAGYPIYLWFH
ncbi:MAG: hypothetical protein G8345_15385 [Magnetococcales bacterium]|nr:hypothetical protein [Magnetococcales bacterium]NGZ28260.1 hypothetical protein [Magnetococcales bacterium]